MARSRAKAKRSRSRGRDYTIASGLPLFSSAVRPLALPSSGLGDRRRYHPSSYPPYETTSGRRVRPRVVFDRPSPSSTRMSYYRALPLSSMVCVRRKTRREVLFAIGRAKAARRPNFNETSTLRC